MLGAILPIAKKVGVNILKKLPGKKPLGRFLKKIAGGGQTQETGEIKPPPAPVLGSPPAPSITPYVKPRIVGTAINEVIKEETMGQVDLEQVRKQPNETTREYFNRLGGAAGSASMEFVNKAKKSNGGKNFGDSFERGAKENVIKKYGLIFGVVVIVILIVVLITKKK